MTLGSRATIALVTCASMCTQEPVSISCATPSSVIVRRPFTTWTMAGAVAAWEVNSWPVSKAKTTTLSSSLSKTTRLRVPLSGISTSPIRFAITVDVGVVLISRAYHSSIEAVDHGDARTVGFSHVRKGLWQLGEGDALGDQQMWLEAAFQDHVEHRRVAVGLHAVASENLEFPADDGAHWDCLF